MDDKIRSRERAIVSAAFAGERDMKKQSDQKTTIKSTPIQGERGKASKDELSEQELDKASGGISLNFTKIEFKNTATDK
jgi:hypothetical protein